MKQNEEIMKALSPAETKLFNALAAGRHQYTPEKLAGSILKNWLREQTLGSKFVENDWGFYKELGL